MKFDLIAEAQTTRLNSFRSDEPHHHRKGQFNKLNDTIRLVWVEHSCYTRA